MSDRNLETLLKLAGERDQPSIDGAQRARLAARESWRRMLQRQESPSRARRGVSIFWALAAAAGIAAAALLFNSISGDAQPLLVAQVLSVDEGAELRGDVNSALRESTRIFSGSEVTTAGGRVALRLGNSLSLRVDRHTRLRFDAADHVTLLEGALYVDSGGINAVPALHIETPAGDVHHVGTQFQVSVAGELTRVRVREGRVLLMPRDQRAVQDLAAGDDLEVAGSRLQLRRATRSYGVEWEWVTLISPAFDIENRPVAEFLYWIAREHGWQLRYADDSLQQHTHEIRLHGSLAGLEATEMIERVSLITGVPMTVRDGVLLVGAVQVRE